MKIDIPEAAAVKLKALADELGTDLSGALEYAVRANAGPIAREAVADASDTVEWTLADGTPVGAYLAFMDSMDSDLRNLPGNH